MKPTEPRAEKRPKEHVEHGHRRLDEFAWLRDDRREDPEVLAHLEAENAWFRHCMSDTAGLQETLFEEMTGRLDPDQSSVPYEKNGFWYYHRFEPGLEHALHGRRAGAPDALEEIILDENERAAKHAYYHLGNLKVSDDHRYVAIAEDTVGRGRHEIRILDTYNGEYLPEVIDHASASLAWSACGQYLFYLEKHPETLLAYRAMRHRLGTPVTADEMVYEEADEHFYNALWRSRSGDYIVLAHHSTDTTEVQLLPADRPQGSFRPFLPREPGHEYDIDHANGRFFIRSNWQARNFRVFETGEAGYGDRDQWIERIPHREDVLVLELVAFDDWLVVAEREDGLRRIRVLSLDGQVDHYLPAAEDPSVMWPDVNPSPHGTRFRYTYTSLITPPQVWEMDLSTRKSRLLKSERIGGGYEPSNYRTARMKILARDGSEIPVSLVHHSDTPLDGSAPALVYAYGAYGLSTDPGFRNSIISLLDRGFVYFIAHIRGGQERGRAWYDHGRLAHKWNTFNDFIDVTRALQEKKLIDPANTFAMGGSAGGLLMGVVINEAPELYKGVVAAVPFVDIVTTMLDESIPLTTGEYREWGDPREPEAFEYMLSYSPFDQVTRRDYPHLMVTTGLHDAMVQYWEPAKWVARIRDRRSNANTLVLRTDMDSGHGGASGRYRQYRDIAEEFAFLLHLAGTDQEKRSR